ARLKPTPQDAQHKAWSGFTDLQKVAWNWSTVNRQCLDFMGALPEDQAMSFSSEAFFGAKSSLIHDLFNFTGSADYLPPSPDIERVMGTKHNAQQEGRFSKPKNWSDQQVRQVNDIIAPVAARLD